MLAFSKNSPGILLHSIHSLKFFWRSDKFTVIRFWSWLQWIDYVPFPIYWLKSSSNGRICYTREVLNPVSRISLAVSRLMISNVTQNFHDIACTRAQGSRYIVGFLMAKSGRTELWCNLMYENFPKFKIRFTCIYRYLSKTRISWWIEFWKGSAFAG